MPLLLTPRSPRGTATRLPAPLRRDSGTIAIGRDPRNDIVLDHPSASSRHCAIGGSGLSWQIKDTSTNGTLVNGQRIAGVQPLRHGDVIGVADLELAVAIAEVGAAQPSAWGQAPAPQPTAPPATVPRGSGGAEPIARAAVEALARLDQARRKARADLKVPAPAEADDPFAVTGGEAVLARLFALPPASGAAAVTKAGETLAAHERATLAAVQAAFRAALDQFSPAAIKQRAKSDTEAWKTYERAFDAADGFVETFAQEMAKAYAATVK